MPFARLSERVRVERGDDPKRPAECGPLRVGGSAQPAQVQLLLRRLGVPAGRVAQVSSERQRRF